ncbi:endolytic transglycosylase MltG [Ornithinibacillus gellani]|uniref:hypothetical protein n=1 Tax=Ornithinibacillus gellani TaxID=2293253 RepID=UPI000F47F5A3|nr:hypothetical protein [Ornithinibacillus gellani]TQS74552.1 endolytic transglycosylase MltG [Ornithinibacillus gellani]
MRSPIRAFSLGLFAAGLIILISSLFFNTSEKRAEEYPVDDMINIMKDEGYRVMSESEYIALSLQKDDEQQKANEDTEKTDKDDKQDQAKDDQTTDSKDNSKKETDKKEDNTKDKTSEHEKTDKKDDKKDDKDKVVTYTLKIESGMPSSTIGDLLEENKVIKDGSKFNKYLEDEGYSLKIQLGNFKVNSDMTFNEIAKLLTK